jgi:hypothetical protein
VDEKEYLTAFISKTGYKGEVDIMFSEVMLDEEFGFNMTMILEEELISVELLISDKTLESSMLPIEEISKFTWKPVFL